MPYRRGLHCFLTVVYVQVGGEKMYDKARRGETVELSPRRISIFQFDIERSLDDRFSVTAHKHFENNVFGWVSLKISLGSLFLQTKSDFPGCML